MWWLWCSGHMYLGSFYLFWLISCINSVLSHKIVATAAFFYFLYTQQIFFQSFSFSLCVSLIMRCVCCRQQIAWSCFDPIWQLYLLMGDLSPFTFRVMVERLLLTPVLVLFCF
jgi:hypothetical protein